MANYSQTDVWNRIDQQSAIINEISRAQAGTDARIAGLESKFEEGFRTINAQLGQLNSRMFAPPKAPNYMGWFAAALGALAMFGGYSMLMITPLQQQIAQNYNMIRDNQEVREKQAYQDGRLDSMQNQLDQVDKYGSRRWNKTEAEDQRD